MVIRDALGASVTIAVTVTPAASIPLAVTPLAATASVGDKLRFTISGGDRDYVVTVNNSSIASVTPVSETKLGGTFDADLLNAGATTIAIIDSKGQTQTIALTVTQLQPLLRLSPGVVAISELSTESLALDIFGGAASYTAFTSDLALSSVSIVGTQVIVGLGTNGTRCIDPATRGYVLTPGVVPPFNVLTGTVRVIITVVDGKGRSATSDVFIVDSAGTCPSP